MIKYAVGDKVVHKDGSLGVVTYVFNRPNTPIRLFVKWDVLNFDLEYGEEDFSEISPAPKPVHPIVEAYGKGADAFSIALHSAKRDTYLVFCNASNYKRCYLRRGAGWVWEYETDGDPTPSSSVVFNAWDRGLKFVGAWHSYNDYLEEISK